METAALISPPVTLLRSATPPQLALGGGQNHDLRPPNGVGGLATAQPATGGQAGRVSKTAQAFEASFLSVMLGQAFSGVEASAPFGGGQGEAMYKSLLTDAFAKSMAQRGGIGVSKAIAAEL